MNKEAIIPWLMRFAMAGFVYFWAVSAALQVLEPRYSFFRTPLSLYVYGAYGVYLTVGFYFLAVATMAWIVGLYLRMRQDPLSRSALALFLVAAISVGMLATWHAPVPGNSHSMSLHGRIHITSSIVAFITATGASIIFSMRFKKDPRWQTLHPYALLLSLLILACLIIILAFYFWKVPLHAFFEKALITALAAWQFLVASHFERMRLAPGAG